MNYRADIDGLRAVAVVSVCIYHAFPSSLNGGFVGVDIFFVISGFLITSIISKSLSNDTFSIFDFYSKRIKRIFPSLITIIIFSVFLGWFILFDSELYQLIKHVFFGSLFSSNFILWSESGYFDGNTDTKPLLHLWSLAVEEQFYIIWPIILILIAKYRRGILAPVIVLILASFIANIFYTKHDQSTAFYFPFTRFWEIAIGGLLAITSSHISTQHHGLNNLISAVGACMVLTAIFTINETYQFPGYWALLPVIGTGLIILAGPNAWLNRTILSSNPMVFIGLISFPLYLWHWIFISMLHIAVENPTPYLMVCALIISLICAYFSYALIETPIRKSNSSVTPAILVSCMLIISTLGLVTHINKAIPDREIMAINRTIESGHAGGLSKIDVSYDCESLAPNLDFKGAKCIRKNNANMRFAVIGDSKADVLAPGLMRTNSSDNNWIFIGGNATDGAPIPIISDNPAYSRHQAFAQETLEFLSNHDNIETVVIAVATRSIFNLRNDRDIEDLPESPYYSEALSGLERGISSLTDKGKKVVLLVDNPTLPPPQSCLARRTGSPFLNRLLSLDESEAGCSIALERHQELSQQYRQLLLELQSKDPENIIIFNTLPILCSSKNGECSTFKDDRALYSFTDHISDYAAGLIGKELNALLYQLEIEQEQG